jgi:hypothetical protein
VDEMQATHRGNPLRIVAGWRVEGNKKPLSTQGFR